MDLQISCVNLWGGCTKCPASRMRESNMSRHVLAVDQVVLIADPQLSRAQWPVGKVTRVLPSNEGAIRAAEVDIKGNTYIRPVAKMIVLPEMPED